MRDRRRIGIIGLSPSASTQWMDGLLQPGGRRAGRGRLDERVEDTG